MDDVMAALEKEAGPVSEVAAYLGKIDGHWFGIPTSTGSQVKPCCSRLDLYQQHCGLDLKKIFPARTQAEKHGEPFTPSPDLCEIVRQCGRAFGIDLYGVDVIESEGRRYVVDMSAMPSFKGIPDAPRLLADYFHGAVVRAVGGSRVLEAAGVP